MTLNRQAFAFTVIPPVVVTAALVILRPAQWDAMRIAGLILAIAGVAFVTLARAQLGNSFSITPQARTLVSTGLYRKVRNPMYVSAAILIAGFVMYVHIPMLLLLLVFLIPMQVLRARAEGAKLEEAFGDQYREWKRQTWF